MFGYVKVYTDNLKIIEQNHYRAIYCGLCKKLGESYGQISRLTLNYDFTFLSLFQLAITKNKTEILKEGCIVHPLTKRYVLKNHDSLQFSADAAVLMIYYKISDDLKDKSIKKKALGTLFKPFMYFARKKAAKRMPDIDKFIKKSMKEQFKLEKENCNSIDSAAMPTAKALGFIFESLAQNDNEKIIFNYFGYNLGKWVYLMDAIDDFEKDVKRKEYNVLSNIYGESISLEELKQNIFPVLNFTRSELINAYHLIDVKRYKPILDNILFLGLEFMQNFIFIKDYNNKPELQSI